MGTPEVDIKATEEAALAAPDIQDDFDIGAEDAQTLDVKDRPEVQVMTPGSRGSQAQHAKLRALHTKLQALRGAWGLTSVLVNEVGFAFLQLSSEES